MIKNWYKFNESNSDEYYNIIKDLLVDISDDFRTEIVFSTPPPSFTITIDVGFDDMDMVGQGYEIYSNLWTYIDVFKERVNNEFFRIGKEISIHINKTSYDNSDNMMDDEELTTIIIIDIYFK